MRTIRTPRLRLVPVTVHNANRLWNVLQEPDLRAYQDLPNMGAAAFTQMVAKRPVNLHPGATGRFEWLIYAAGVRRASGWVSLRITERDLTTGEIGYSLLREFRGRGIASEAVRGLLGEAFERGGLSRVQAYCVPENLPSRQLLERLGFRHEGVLPHGATVSGRPVDVLMQSLNREAWRQSGNSMVMPASAYPA